MSRGYCWTLNNYTQEEVDNLKTWGQKEVDSEKVKYLIAGEEIGDEKKTPHLQGFIYYKNKKKAIDVKKDIGKRAHIEVAKGTPQQAANYCKKDGKFWEIGLVPIKGKRTDIDNIREGLKKGKTLKEISNECKSLQSLRFANEWLKYNDNGTRENIDVTWIFGKSNSGKTFMVNEYVDHEDTYIKSSSTGRWWDGYYGQKTVVLDEFRDEHISASQLFSMLQPFPFRIETKGGTCFLKATTFYVTTIQSPWECYSSSLGEDIIQLLRRINLIVYIGPKQTMKCVEDRLNDNYVGKEGIRKPILFCTENLRSGVILGPDLRSDTGTKKLEKEIY